MERAIELSEDELALLRAAAAGDPWDPRWDTACRNLVSRRLLRRRPGGRMNVRCWSPTVEGWTQMKQSRRRATR